jgi:DEAD/DEAH box helicase domain-containing protein
MGVVFFDLETQTLVPDDRRLETLRISVAGIMDEDGATTYFAEHETDALFARLDSATRIVGYNLILFDYKVLQRYASFDVAARYKEKTYDPFLLLMRKTDRRIALNDLAQRNLGIEKLGSGKDAPQLFQDGKHEELRAYLRQDLAIVRDLFAHIVEHRALRYGHIVYKEPIEKTIAISVEERP